MSCNEEILCDKVCDKCEISYPNDNYRKYSETKFGRTCKKCLNELDKTRKKNLRQQKAENTIAKCEKCQEKLKKQLLFKNLPKILIIHVYNNPRNKTDYSSSIIINSKKYILLSALCFNGGHWNCIGRHNNLWHVFDDTNIRSFKENEFPVSSLMRVLIYYQE